jgi:hypothetical protein
LTAARDNSSLADAKFNIDVTLARIAAIDSRALSRVQHGNDRRIGPSRVLFRKKFNISGRNQLDHFGRPKPDYRYNDHGRCCEQECEITFRHLTSAGASASQEPGAPPARGVAQHCSRASHCACTWVGVSIATHVTSSEKTNRRTEASAAAPAR